MIVNETVRVLLADDDSEDRNDFLEAFESLKIVTNVNTVKNGIELMNFLTNPSVKLPHLVFLDLNMPKKSGLECLMEIRRLNRLKDLTVVIYSTSSSEKDVEETFLNGANIYVKKPAHLTMLKKTLLQVLTINWQYHIWGLNRDRFLLKL
jgi:CheY-like chemotaxis protein